MNRREFVAGATAFALAGCSKQLPLMSLREVANRKNVQFIDSDGKLVNLAGLQASMNGNYSTMSFMFAACGDICPLTATELTKLSVKHTSLKHIVISVDPAGDFANHHLRNVLQAQGMRVTGANPNTIILYPSADGTSKPVSLITSHAAEIEHGFNLVTIGDAAEYHSGAVTLFDQKGKMLAQSVGGSGSIIPTLVKHLPPSTAQQR